MYDAIGRALRTGLLQDIGDDEERLQHLRSAASGVAGIVGEQPRLLPHVLLTALDQNSDAPSTALQMAEASLLDVWEMFPNAFPSTPFEILRIVLLHAVNEASASDTRLAAAAWYQLRTGVELLDVGTWDTIAAEMLSALMQELEETLDSEWLPDPQLPAVIMPSVKASGFTATALTALSTEHIKTEVVAKFAEPQPTQAGMHTAIPELLSELVKSVSDDLTSLSTKSQTNLGTTVTEIGKTLRAALDAQGHVVAATARRTNLLWWRTTLWSPGRGRAYRDLDNPAEVAVQAAADLHEQSPYVAPLVLEHLLTEVVVAALSNDEPLVPLKALAEAAAELPTVPDVETAGTRPLLEVARHQLKEGSAPPGTAESFLEERPASAASVLVFRELQTARLLGEVAKGVG